MLTQGIGYKTILTGLIILCFAFSALAQTGQVQKADYTNMKDAFLSESKLTGKPGPGSINWIDGGKRFSYIKNDDQKIYSFNPGTKKDEVIFDPEGVKFPGTADAFKFMSFQWSRDSKYILFQTNFRPVWRRSGISDFYFYSIADKSLKLVAKDAQTAEISPDGQKVGYEREGNLFVFDFAAAKEDQLTNDAKAYFYNGRFGWVYQEEFGLAQAWLWSPDSKYLAFWQTDERLVPLFQMTDYSGQHAQYINVPYPKVGDPVPLVKIGVIDLAAKSTKWMNIAPDGGYIPRLYWTADPGVLAVVQLNRKQNDLKLSFYNGLTGDGKLVMEETSKQWIDVVNFSGILHFFLFPTDKKEFFWISDRDGWSHIYRYNYKGEIINQVTKGNWEVSKIEAVDSKNNTIYYSGTEVSPLERHLYAINFDGSNKRLLAAQPGTHKVNVAPNGEYYMDTYSTVNTPSRIELWSAKNKLVKVFKDDSDVKQFVAAHFYSPRELFSFKTADGQKLDGYLIKPKDFDPAKKYPLVMNIYGGPGSEFVMNEFATDTWEQYLAQKGYVVANVNNRGAGGYGRDFQKIVYRNLGKYQSRDFVETAQYLATLPGIDGHNMAIKGRSFGGFMSSFTMLSYPDVFKVALVAAPVTDWLLYDALYTERFMDVKEDNAEGYKINSSVALAANLKGKMFLAHSALDENVHLQNTMQLDKAFIDAGKDVDLRIYPPGAHQVGYSPASFELLYPQYLDYLNKYLKGDFTSDEVGLIGK